MMATVQDIDVPHVRERPLLDLLRWSSAALVAIGHIIGVVVHRPPRTAFFHSVDGVLSYFSDFRGGSVVVFFVLSGYLVGGSLLRRRESTDWLSYLVARFSRIYIVLLPALAFTALVDGALIATRHGPSIYTSVWQSGVLGADALIGRYDLGNVVSSLFCLEPLFGRPIGSNGVLWSLGYEWIFYLAFPLIVLGGARAPTRAGPYVVSAVVLVAVFVAHAHWMATFSAIWICGACAEQLGRQGRVPLALTRLAGVLAVLAFLAAPLMNVRLSTCLIGLSVAVFLSRRDPWEQRITSRRDRRLSSFSYSLYLSHLTTVVAVGELAVRSGYLGSGGLPASPVAFALMAVMAATALAVALGFYWAFERRTDVLRKVLFKALFGTGRPARAGLTGAQGG